MAGIRLQTKTVKNILMELRKVCQHPYLAAPDLEAFDVSEEEQHRQLVSASGKLQFLKLLLPKLKERGHRVLIFSQFKMSLDRIQDFLWGEGTKFLRLDGNTPAAKRQRYMDLYNAPDSEYDVFLLTTRAGGVGINLATADTVIIHDPDFNPHQDLQAIARAHRFGQKKRVLVFRLMVKGSVEENIMNSGKKKMVLDHLVVQQMGKETDEAAFESDLFLQGIQSVYSTQSGINGPDIVYNSKNVDELIDKVEADAEAQAKVMEEWDAAISRGEVEPTKQGAQFGFAKIWEADQNALREAEEAAAQQEADADWERIVETIQKEKEEREERELAASRVARRNRLRLEAQYVDREEVQGMEDGNDSTDRKRQWVSKGKRATTAQSSDAEYDGAGDVAAASDDETVSISGSVPEVPDLSLKPTPTDGPRGLSSAHYGQDLADGLIAKVKKKGNDDPTVPAPRGAEPSNTILHDPSAASGSKNGRGKSRKQKETSEETARRKRPKLQPQTEVPLAAAAAAATNSAEVPLAAAASATNGAALRTEQAMVAASQQVGSSSVRKNGAESNTRPVVMPLDAETIVAGQNVLQWLYQVLREFKWYRHIEGWAMLGLENVSLVDRMKIYSRIAGDVDKRLIEYGQGPYFTGFEPTTAVQKLLQANGPVIPQLLSVPPMPHGAGYKAGQGLQSREPESTSTTAGHSTPNTPVAAPTVASPADGQTAVSQDIRSSLPQPFESATAAGRPVAAVATATLTGASSTPAVSAVPVTQAITASAPPSTTPAPSVPAPAGSSRSASVPARGSAEEAEATSLPQKPLAPLQQKTGVNELGTSPLRPLPTNTPTSTRAPSPALGSPSQPPPGSNTHNRDTTPGQTPIPYAAHSVSHAAPSCEYCRRPHHISQCTYLTPLPELAQFLRAVLRGQTSPETRKEDLRTLERMRQLHIKGGNLAPDAIFPPPSPPRRAAPSGAASRSNQKLPREAIDDDDESVKPQQPGQSRPAESSASTAGGQSRESQKTASGASTCVVCIGQGHDMRHCPAMQTTAGVQTTTGMQTTAGMRQTFHAHYENEKRTSNDMYSAPQHHHAEATTKEFPINPEAARTITHFHPRPAKTISPIPSGSIKPPLPPPVPPVVADPLPVCPFCETPCGRTVKDCVVATGSRKALKDKIRALEEQLIAGTGNAKQIKDRQIPLYNVYRNWPRT